jgi:glyoxylase-like metal-dependent hydrolase (beta-lactamase superfamily II)
MKYIAEGFIILKRYGSFKNACWILYNNGEGAIVEMPHFKRSEKSPPDKAKIFFKKNKIYPKYAFVSHSHWDHCYSLPLFRGKFPHTCFLAHNSFFSDPYMKYVLRTMSDKNCKYGLYDEVFYGDYWQGELGGEPIFIIYAPKHSYSDLMIIFRGAMITGDWYIGDIQDCNPLVKREDKIRSITKLQHIIHEMNYNVHMLFSAHGDSLFYNADFQEIMEACKIDHKGKKIDLPAVFIPEQSIKHCSLSLKI